MEKKKTEGIYVVIAVLSVCVIVLAILVVYLLCDRKEEKENDTGDTSASVETDISEEVAEKETETETEIGTEDIPLDINVVEDSEDYIWNGIYIIIGGFRFNIPPDYECIYSDGIGPVIYVDDAFQMRLGIAGKSYDEAMQNPSILTQKTIEAGGEILQDVREEEVDGKAYAYFRMELYGEQCFVIYTQSPDKDKRIGGQIAVFSDDLSDEYLLNVFASIVTSAELTDEPDTTLEDIQAQYSFVNYGEVKEESTLSFGSATLTFKVPEGMYSQGIYEGTTFCVEYFQTEGNSVSVGCYLRSVGGEKEYKSVEDYIETTRNFEFTDDVKEESKIQRIDIEGTTCCYIDAHYEYEGRDRQKIYAACSVGENHIFTVEADATDLEEDLTINLIKDYFIFK